MAERIILPKQGLQMSEGTITQWLKSEGDEIKAGEPLFEMETDKLTITIDSPHSGVLLKILHEEGETVPNAEVIAIIGDLGEDIEAEIKLLSKKSGATLEPEEESKKLSVAEHKIEPQEQESSGRVFITPRAKALATSQSIRVDAIKGSGPEGLIIEQDVSNYSTKISPLARKISTDENISLEQVKGSGARGKIMSYDLPESGTSVDNEGQEEQLVPFSGMRKIIADRMYSSLQNSAQTHHFMHVFMDKIAELRKNLNTAEKKYSYNDFVVLAVAKALSMHPEFNATIADDAILMKTAINIGIAVATEKGLLVPVVHHAERLRLEGIRATIKALSEKAKTNRLLPEDMQGGTFTISNLGMYGLDAFVPIINTPEVAILGVGAVKKIPAVMDNGELGVRLDMQLILTFDHRAVDGAPAAELLRSIKILLENPAMLL